MRRIEFLINEVRQSTDNRDVNGISDLEIISYFNSGVKFIQNIIFKNMPLANFFMAIQEYQPTAPDAEYDIPSDCFAENAIATVEARFGSTTINQGYRALKRTWQETRSDFFGYTTYNRKLVVTGTEINLAIESIRLWYFKRARRFDKRWGTITSFIPSTSLTLDAATLDSDFSNVDDTLSIVNASGEVVLAGVPISSVASNVVNTTSPLTGVSNGDFIVCGNYSTTLCDLPDECEVYLLDYVKQRIYTRNNYEDAGKQVYFTNQQQQDITAIFANNVKDIVDPPITDTEFLEI